MIFFAFLVFVCVFLILAYMSVNNHFPQLLSNSILFDQFTAMTSVEQMMDKLQKTIKEAVKEEAKKTRQEFQQLLCGSLPASDEAKDPQEELRAIKAAKLLLTTREQALQALVGTSRPSKRQRIEPSESSVQISEAQLKMAQDFMKKHEKLDPFCLPRKYIGGYLQRTVEEHGMKALRQSLKSYWACVDQFRATPGWRHELLLAKYLEKEWVILCGENWETSKSPSFVVAEFVRRLRHRLECKDEP
jgi:hypothetical protein